MYVTKATRLTWDMSVTDADIHGCQRVCLSGHHHDELIVAVCTEPGSKDQFVYKATESLIIRTHKVHTHGQTNIVILLFDKSSRDKGAMMKCKQRNYKQVPAKSEI